MINCRFKIFSNSESFGLESEVNSFLAQLDASSTHYQVTFSVKPWAVDGVSGSEFVAFVIFGGSFNGR